MHCNEAIEENMNIGSFLPGPLCKGCQIGKFNFSRSQRNLPGENQQIGLKNAGFESSIAFMLTIRATGLFIAIC
jgi:hypothetical protein